MSQNKSDGFTLVELLVVLVLSALSLTLILPSITRDPVSNSARIAGFSTAMLAFTAEVRERQSALEFTPDDNAKLANYLAVPAQTIIITQSINVAASGACLSGQFRYIDNSVNMLFEIESPLCRLVLVDEQ